MNKNLEVIALSKKQLKTTLSENIYWKGTISPFSKNKLSWLLKNKRISEEDFCCVLALENKNVIGFLYIVPDLIQVKNSEPQKVFWLKHWWVENQFKASILPTYLFNETLKYTKNKVIIKDYANHVDKFYSKQPLNKISETTRSTIFFSPATYILIFKIPFLKYIKPLVKLLDFSIYKIVKYINAKKIASALKNITYEYISEIDDHTWNFIKPFCKNDIIYKTKEYVSWQLNPTQYVQSINSKNLNSNDLINGTSKNIYLHKIKVFNNGNLIGFMAFSYFKQEITIKYFMCKDSDLDLMTNALIDQIIKLNVRLIFTLDTRVSKNIKKRFLTIFTYSVKKKGLAHNSIIADLDGYNLTERDGHFI